MNADNEFLPRAVELINGSIMSEQPILVVEGATDLNIYRKIASKTGKNICVRPVELIRGYGEGCSEVLRLIEELETSEVTAGSIAGNLVGIIDKDVREYREETPNSNNVIMMRFYSIESHFIFSEAIIPCLKLSIPNLNDETLPLLKQQLFSNFVESIHILRLASLDALKGAIDSTYSSDFSYSDSFGRLNDASLATRLRDKQDELVLLSNHLGIDDSLDSMKMIIKGKVFLDALTTSILLDLRELHSSCGVDPVPECNFCAGGKKTKCELRIAPAVTDSILKNIILNQFPEDELSYLVDLIVERLS